MITLFTPKQGNKIENNGNISSAAALNDETMKDATQAVETTSTVGTKRKLSDNEQEAAAACDQKTVE